MAWFSTLPSDPMALSFSNNGTYLGVIMKNS